MPLSTVPWLFELPTGLFSTLIREPPCIARRLLHESIKLVKAGSLSHCTIMSTNCSPISCSHAINLRQIHCPVGVLGTTVLSTAFVSFSRATKNVDIVLSLSSPYERVVQMHLGDTAFCFGRFPTGLLHFSAIDAMSTPAPLAGLTRIMFAHCVPGPGLLLLCLAIVKHFVFIIVVHAVDPRLTYFLSHVIITIVSRRSRNSLTSLVKPAPENRRLLFLPSIQFLRSTQPASTSLSNVRFSVTKHDLVSLHL